MVLTSNAFTSGQPIPPRYTADGANVSPSLSWQDAPAGTKSFALISDDPDAPGGTWVHWVVYNIPQNTNTLPEGVSPQQIQGVREGINDFHKTGYGGPSPPRGEHRYFFTLYALDSELSLPAGVSKRQLLTAMEGHVLDEAHLMGTYRR